MFIYLKISKAFIMKKTKGLIILGLAMFVTIPQLSAQEPEPLKKGDKAPSFTAYDDKNQIWNINEYIGKKNIVIFFYPAAMTGGCTSQACSYRDSYADIEKENAIVVGISGDEVENLKYFRDANNLNFPLLSDNSGDIARKFGVPVGKGNTITRTINDKEVVLQRGVTARRWTFIVNREGNISYINQEVNAGNDSREVLNILQGNNRN